MNNCRRVPEDDSLQGDAQRRKKARYGWLFNDATFSDLIIELRMQDDLDLKTVMEPVCASSSDGTERSLDFSTLNAQWDDEIHSTSRSAAHDLTQLGDSSDGQKRFHGHAVILAAASAYFRSLLKCSAKNATIVVCVRPEECIAAEAMLQFCYTQQLQLTDEHEVLRCLVVANRYLLNDCVAACCKQLQRHLSSAVVPWHIVLGVLRLPTCHLAAAPVTQLVVGCHDAVYQVFGRLEDAWQNGKMHSQFMALPYSAIKALLQREDVVVVSENTVLLAVSCWVAAQASECTAAQRAELAALLRLPHLTASFLAGLVDEFIWLRDALHCTYMQHLTLQEHMDTSAALPAHTVAMQQSAAQTGSGSSFQTTHEGDFIDVQRTPSGSLALWEQHSRAWAHVNPTVSVSRPDACLGSVAGRTTRLISSSSGLTQSSHSSSSDTCNNMNTSSNSSSSLPAQPHHSSRARTVVRELHLRIPCILDLGHLQHCFATKYGEPGQEYRGVLSKDTWFNGFCWRLVRVCASLAFAVTSVGDADLMLLRKHWHLQQLQIGDADLMPFAIAQVVKGSGSLSMRNQSLSIGLECSLKVCSEKLPVLVPVGVHVCFEVWVKVAGSPGYRRRRFSGTMQMGGGGTAAIHWFDDFFGFDESDDLAGDSSSRSWDGYAHGGKLIMGCIIHSCS